MKMLKTVGTVREREREHNFNKLSFTFCAQNIVLVGIRKVYFIRNIEDRLRNNIKVVMQSILFVRFS